RHRKNRRLIKRAKLQQAGHAARYSERQEQQKRPGAHDCARFVPYARDELRPDADPARGGDRPADNGPRQRERPLGGPRAAIARNDSPDTKCLAEKYATRNATRLAHVASMLRVRVATAKNRQPVTNRFGMTMSASAAA